MIRSLPLLLLTFSAVAAEPLDVEALLDHHAAAQGVSRESAPAGALHVVAQLEGFGLSGTLESWSEAPLRSRSILRLGPITLETGFDGETAWIRDRNDAVREAEAQERDGMLLETLVQTGAYLLRRPPLEIDFAAAELDSDRVQLTLTPGSGDALQLVLDAYSHRVLLSSWHNGQMEETTRYLDYDWFDGLLLPRRMELDQGNLHLVSTLQSVERIAARGAAFYAMPRGDLPQDLRLGEDGSSGRLPMQGEGSHILLAGKVGERAGRFLFDTGAGSNVLSATVARELGLVGEGEFEAIGVSGLENASFVELPSVRLGSMELVDQSWVTLEFGALQSVLGEDLLGVLGYDTLSRLVAHVDYASRSVEFLARSNFTPPTDATPLTLRMDLNVPTIAVEVEGHPAWMHVDTGSDNSVDLSAPFVAEHELLEGREGLQRSQLLGVGGVKSSWLGELSNFSLGPFDYDDVTAYFHEAGDGIFENRSAAGIVGAAILSDYELWFDYADRKLWLRPAD